MINFFKKIYSLILAYRNFSKNFSIGYQAILMIIFRKNYCVFKIYFKEYKILLHTRGYSDLGGLQQLYKFGYFIQTKKKTKYY